MLSNSVSFADLSSPSDACVCPEKASNHIVRKRRKPAGTPDPDAEVVALSPEALMESDHYVCEICHQGFQREQNLQMHRRRHKIPWKLLKGEAASVRECRKRVYVCPEPTCLHHDPCHALGDLVGIKKHFRRKHSNYKQWVCHKCSKAYAVQSDYKAHLKTCGTKGHSCDCGRVFSRVDSFMEHQDVCKGRTMISTGADHHLKPVTTPVSVLQTLIRPAPIMSNKSLPRSDACLNLTMSWQKVPELVNLRGNNKAKNGNYSSMMISSCFGDALEVQPPLVTNPSNSLPTAMTNFPLCANPDEYQATQLKLSVGTLSPGQEQEAKNNNSSSSHSEPKQQHDLVETRLGENVVSVREASTSVVSEMRKGARELLQIAMHEKAMADERRKQAKWQVQLAEEEFGRARQIRQKAVEELSKARVFQELATRDKNCKAFQITCQSCKKQFQRACPSEWLQAGQQEFMKAELHDNHWRRRSQGQKDSRIQLAQLVASSLALVKTRV